ncbi:hypothetical protein ZWY2020_003590 [Hordeum vulgare]|nr:hypothetical protein ZWY2020_003590 [Hordeum vulgare]
MAFLPRNRHPTAQMLRDSDLVVQQVSGEWDARDANMASYRFLIQQLSGPFEGCEFHHVPTAKNEAADTLAKIGSTRGHSTGRSSSNPQAAYRRLRVGINLCTADFTILSAAARPRRTPRRLH